MHNNFLHTTDTETAEKLIQLGFQLIKESDGKYTFENQPLLNFSLNEQSGLKYIKNNKLTF